MRDLSPPPDANSPDAIAAWLDVRGLRLPAWTLLALAQPFGWLLGQAALTVQPGAALLGWGGGWERLAAWLDDPARLTALLATLEQEDPRC